MFCKHCGKPVGDTDRFCSTCGGALNETQATAPAADSQIPSSNYFAPPIQEAQPNAFYPSQEQFTSPLLSATQLENAEISNEEKRARGRWILALGITSLALSASLLIWLDLLLFDLFFDACAVLSFLELHLVLLGLILGSVTRKCARSYASQLGPLTGAARVGSNLGTAGRIAGIVGVPLVSLLFVFFVV